MSDQSPHLPPQAPPHVFVIAEAGVNHNGSVERARDLIRVAAEAGANAIKFQTFKADRIASSKAAKADYQARNTGDDGSQIAMLKALELSDEDHRQLADLCGDIGIEFMSTPFDEDSATFLANDIGVIRLKVGSGELTNAPLLLHMARTAKPIILSTGMATIDEIETALGVLAYGYTAPPVNAFTVSDFAESFASEDGQAALQRNVTLLHCTSDYPAAAETINLNAMSALRDAFGLPVGFSDHSQGIAVPTAAVAMGAVMVEKHFTLDRTLEGPDHAASLEPDELAAMMMAIRTVEAALGSSTKQPGEAERKTAAVARKSLVALTDISAGNVFTPENLGIKRPGTGVSPLDYWSYLGQPSAREYAKDDVIDPQ